MLPFCQCAAVLWARVSCHNGEHDSYYDCVVLCPVHKTQKCWANIKSTLDCRAWLNAWIRKVLLQGPDMTNPCCKVWLDGAKATAVDDRPDRPPGCNLVCLLSSYLFLHLHRRALVVLHSVECSSAEIQLLLVMLPVISASLLSFCTLGLLWLLMLCI